MRLLVLIGEDELRVHPRGKGLRGSPRGVARLLDALQPPAIVVEWQELRQPAIRVAAGDLEHSRSVSRQPDLGWALRGRLQPQHRLLQAEMLALEIDRPIAGPEQANDANGFFQPAHRTIERDP